MDPPAFIKKTNARKYGYDSTKKAKFIGWSICSGIRWSV